MRPSSRATSVAARSENRSSGPSAPERGAHPGPGFAMLRRDDLRLLLNTPGGGGGAGQPMRDGTMPVPGGWNRIQIEVDDLDATVDALRRHDIALRSEIIQGNGGRQVVADDPSGNPIELFEPRRGD
ncbi:VOC family protein [Actinomarinicola tropica]|nr:VOC family protein [Actinomarinicola tropica]